MNLKVVVAFFTILLPVTIVNSACGHSPEKDPRSSRTPAVLTSSNNHGWLGVSIVDVTSNLVRKKDLKVEAGVFVSNVADEGPADEAGIKKGDVILEYDGKTIRRSDDLVNEVSATKPGTEVSINLDRGGESKTLKAKIEGSRRARTFSFNMPRMPKFRLAPPGSGVRISTLHGMTLEDLTKQLGEYFGVADGKGVLVKNVRSNSDAGSAGIKAGDIIVTIGKSSVSDIDDVIDALDGYKDGEQAGVEVLRKGSTQSLTLTISDRDSDLSIRHSDEGGDIDLDWYTPEEGRRFRKETEQLKRELQNLKGERLRMF